MRKLLKLFKRDKTASVAMERLHIIVSHKKWRSNGNKSREYLPQLKQDLIEVIRRYVEVDENCVNVNLDQSPTNDTLVLNIGLKESTTEEASNA